MTTSADRDGSTAYARLATLLFSGVLALALLLLILWAVNLWQFGTLVQRDVPMAPSTAVLMSLLALAGLRPAARWQALVSGLLLVAAGTLALLENISPIESGLVPFLTVAPATGGAVPIGVMSPITATAFILCGLSLLTRHARGYAVVQTGQVCATVVIVLAASIASGYVLGIPSMYGTRVPMAASSTLAFLGVALALVLASPTDTWPMSIVRNPATGTESVSVSRGLALVFIVVTATVVIGTTLYLVSLRRELRREATDVLSAAAALKQDEVARWFKERVGDAGIVRGSGVSSDEVAAFLAERPSQGDATTLLEWMTVLREAYGYSAVVLYDRNGVIRLSSGGPAAQVSRAALERALGTGDVVFDDLDKDDASGTRQMSFLTPIGHPERVPLMLIGVMAFIVEARHEFYPMVEHWPLGSSIGDVVLAREEGGDAVFLLERQQVDRSARTLLRLPMYTPGLAVAQVLQGRGGSAFDGVDYLGQEVVAVGGPVPGTPWSLIAKQNVEAIDAPFWLEVRRTAAVSLLLLTTTGLGLTAISRRESVRSMTAMLAGQRERERSDARLRTAMAGAIDAFIILDPRGRIVEWNRQAEITFGWSDQGPAGRPFIETALWQDGQSGYDAALDAGRSGRPHPLLDARCTTRAVRTNGAEFPVEITLTPIRRRDETSFSAVVRDITDRVRADAALVAAHTETELLLDEADRARRSLLNIVEDQRRTEEALRNSEMLLETRVQQRTRQLETANRELEAFSYSVSHDLRAPLRAIDGYARMLVEDHATQFDAEGRRRLEVVQREARRMGVLIDDLLRFSRVGRQTLSVQSVDMTRMVREVMDELRAAAPARTVEFMMGELPQGLADPGVIRQVWMNLLGNALKFTGTRPVAHVEVGGRIENGQTMYFVRDNGVGFDMKYADKLFGVFQRLHASADFEGTGVGLALSQRIVNGHGGRLWADGVVDRGATFSFSLPVDATPAAS